MAYPRLSEKILRETWELARKHPTLEAAAKEAGVPSATFRSRIARARAMSWAEENNIPYIPLEDTAAAKPIIALPYSADDCWAVLDRAIGRSQKDIPQHPRRGSHPQRVVIASDFHAPFQCNASVGELIAREKDRTDLLIIAGDLQDFYSISRFLKYEKMPIEMELAAADALLGQLASAFPKVLIVEGNHDTARFEKQLRSNLSPDLVHVVQFLASGELSTLKAIAKRYPNVEFGSHWVQRHRVNWFTQVGDLLITHAEKFSRVPGAVLRGIEEWFADRQNELGLAPWRVLIQAHTHQLGIFPWRSDKLLVESGCMCETHGYQLQPGLGGRPQRRGYIRLEQRDGATDLNSVQMRWLDVAMREGDKHGE